jgi:hypothetical protein
MYLGDDNTDMFRALKLAPLRGSSIKIISWKINGTNK